MTLSRIRGSSCRCFLRSFGSTSAPSASNDSKFDLGGLKMSKNQRKAKAGEAKDWNALPSHRPQAPRMLSRGQDNNSNNSKNKTHHREAPHHGNRPLPSRQQPARRNGPPSPRKAQGNDGPLPETLQEADQSDIGIPLESSADVIEDTSEPADSSKRIFQRRRDPQEKKKVSEKTIQREKAAADAQRAKLAHEKQKAGNQPRRGVKQKQIAHKLDIPSIVSVSNLARLLTVKQGRLQRIMESIGLTDTRPDRILTAEESAMIALEFDIEPVFDNEKAFDIFPDPTPTDTSSLPLRPPIVTIMGHVDHGKTTLLDTLRSTSVAAGEAGGITQHIGAFQVRRSDLLVSTNKQAQPSKEQSQADAVGTDLITFLDTPGHAAFSNMRKRGRGITDVVVLVVAADDGVMAQTQEVIDLVKDGHGGVDPNIAVVVAVTKCDKPGCNPLRAKEGLASAGLTVEELGGDVPSIEVSAHSGQGMSELLETITTLAELRDLRAEQSSVRTEGRVIESRVEKGRGNVATVLVMRGQLKVGANIVAGVSRCRVRQLTPPTGKAIQLAMPGQPVEITGWKELPSAGDEVLEASSEDEAKRALEARQRRKEQLQMFSDVEAINEKRRIEAEQEAVQRAAQEARQRAGQSAFYDEAAPKGSADEPELKELPLIIRADVNGTAEAVAGVLEGIGNKQARVKIVSSEVGDVTESDLTMAKSAGATIIGFNVKCPRSIQTHAQSSGIEVLLESVIYRLAERVTEKVVSLLPVIVNSRITGEASILQVFRITIKGRQTVPVAGCRIGNGAIARGSKVRVMRGQEMLWQGSLETLKQGKTETPSVNKGSECGMSFEGFQDFEAGDQVLAVEEYEVARSL